MGTLVEIHVRAPRSPELDARLTRYGDPSPDSGSGFCAVELARHGDPTASDIANLAALSAELDTDVLWLGFSSVSDAFRFHHWRSGRQLRGLAFGCHEQGIWELADGEPEPWERGAWAESDVREGRSEPSIDARESARAVAEFYRLPGWS